MTLRYEGRLPPGALVTSFATHRQALPETGASAPVWLTADPTLTTPSDTDPRRIVGWTARAGDAEALPTAPNTAGTLFEVDNRGAALRFEAGEHGGLILSGQIPDAGCTSFGILFRTTQQDAETLLTLMPEHQKDYLYLAGRNAEIKAEQDKGPLALAQGLEQKSGASVLVICGVSNGQVSLKVNDLPAISGALAGGEFAGPADLFIGCRGQRPGLRRKLGSFLLTDVLLWPGHDCLAMPSDPALASALSYWRGGTNAGV